MQWLTKRAALALADVALVGYWALIEALPDLR